jgi:hypothetical protein
MRTGCRDCFDLRDTPGGYRDEASDGIYEDGGVVAERGSGCAGDW